MQEDIIQQLKTLISAVGSVQIVYDSIPDQFSKYPAVVIMPGNWEDSYLNMGTKKRTYRFTITVYGNLQDTNVNTQKTIRAIVDGILDVLDSSTNLTLAGKIDFPISASGSYSFDNNLKQYLGTINLAVTVQKSMS